ncbi:HAD-IA family hydrolase [Mycobacterium sp. 050134]|uniref:HAD-IA family hydrolase n=1 Tax=Mycobacterium sp. 050134 TaxID=3096111 RepID=UPI002ED9B107
MTDESTRRIEHARDGLELRFGSGVQLETPVVNWDNRAVCHAQLPNGRKVVVKIDADGVRHRRETAGLLAAARGGAPVPRMLWHGFHGSWLLVLEEIPTSVTLADAAGAWRTAGGAVRALHDCPIPPDMAMFCEGGVHWRSHVDHRIATECKDAVARGLLNQHESDAVRRYSMRVLAAAGPASAVLLHGDLQARHLLAHRNQIILIDFGDAGWGDPAMDLVVLTHLDPQRIEDVLDGYGADKYLRERVAQLGPLYSLWRNLFVSRWYFDNAFEQHRNSELARHIVDTVVMPNDVITPIRLECCAVLIDFDGLLIDTEYAGWQSWHELYARYGGNLAITTWAQRCGGDDPLSPWQELEEIAGTILDRDSMEQARRTRRDFLLTVLPGVHRFLQRCQDRGIVVGLVSNSPLKWIERQMMALGVDPDGFRLIVSGEGHAPKPAPDGYLIALASLGLSAERVVAFEDSAKGISAAKAAGLRCVVVPNRVTIHSNLSHADAVVDALDAIELVSTSGAVA